MNPIIIMTRFSVFSVIGMGESKRNRKCQFLKKLSK